LIVKPAGFDELNRAAQVYPSFLLPKDGGTALSLFAAGFWGWNDGIHLIRAGLTIDFVDTDRDKLFEMASLMPQGHAFHVDDAWEFAARAVNADREWDVVSVDPFMGDAADRAWDTFHLWTMVARKMLTLTVTSDKRNMQLYAPEGWTMSFFPRNERVDWLVMTRDA
jgi:hypothetical protein